MKWFKEKEKIETPRIEPTLIRWYENKYGLRKRRVIKKETEKQIKGVLNE